MNLIRHTEGPRASVCSALSSKNRLWSSISWSSSRFSPCCYGEGRREAPELVHTGTGPYRDWPSPTAGALSPFGWETGGTLWVIRSLRHPRKLFRVRGKLNHSEFHAVYSISCWGICSAQLRDSATYQILLPNLSAVGWVGLVGRL